MPAVSLSGVTISWSLRGLAIDPLAEFLGAFTLERRETSEPPSGATMRFELSPAPPGAAADPRDEGWTPSFFHGIVEAHYGAPGFLVWDRASRVLIPPGGGPIDAQIALPEREVVPGSLKTVLQVAFALGLRRCGLYHLHAAALLLPSGVPVVVVGGSGAGKTSTTLALLEGYPGAHYLGDDTLYLARPAERGDTAPHALEVVAFPRDFHIGGATLAGAPRLAALLGPLPTYGTKRSLDPRRAYPGRFRPSLSLGRDGAALGLFPVVARTETTTIVPLERADAFGRLLGSSGAIVCDGVPGREENLGLLQRLLGAVRCFEVRLGRDAIGEGVGVVADKLRASFAQGGSQEPRG